MPMTRPGRAREGDVIDRRHPQSPVCRHEGGPAVRRLCRPSTKGTGSDWEGRGGEDLIENCRLPMKRKCQLISETFKAKKQRLAAGAERAENEGPEAVESALQFLASLFPRKLFEDSLPPLILRHQIYSLVKSRTTVDRYLNQLKDEGRIRMFQHGFDADTLVLAFTDSYKTKVLEFVSGKEFARTVTKFLDSVLASCPDISFDKKKMLGEFGFSDAEITQLVNAGVLTVRDAGSWWLAVPGAGHFVKYFIKGRKTVLGMIQKAKYKEVLLSDLQNRRAPNTVKLGLPYHIHDIIGAQLVDCVPTTSGTLLRLAED